MKHLHPNVSSGEERENRPEPERRESPEPKRWEFWAKKTVSSRPAGKKYVPDD